VPPITITIIMRTAHRRRCLAESA